ncbi:hypothetical protein C1Y35_18710 [Pseudomonas sp. GW456-L14]|uniref:tail fiber assembly protein n=1 Tax=unclassified Pseudomonas TaxID=196821 RepID=UPI000C88CC8F|nr:MULTISPECIES: tail fiber assembly protein [unclassified Pseudomonas]PMY37949.1 hypothetical protein C1Y35_18710 [Pseudomonas sp. GW456-L14]PMY57280.1 hypothetical protein C1Y34_10200 [Pseudomonas sp. GW456-L12]
MTDTTVNTEFSLALSTPEIEWAAIRTRRDQLLRATDVTQLADYPASEAQRAEVAAYRKALRDIPQQGKVPSELIWPELPDFMK